MPDFAETLIPNARRVVLDRTGLTGEYSFYMELGIDPAGPLAILGAIDASRPKQMEALEELGLKLETGTAPVEVWTVEHAERPTEN